MANANLAAFACSLYTSERADPQKPSQKRLLLGAPARSGVRDRRVGSLSGSQQAFAQGVRRCSISVRRQEQSAFIFAPSRLINSYGQRLQTFRVFARWVCTCLACPWQRPVVSLYLSQKNSAAAHMYVLSGMRSQPWIPQIFDALASARGLEASPVSGVQVDRKLSRSMWARLRRFLCQAFV